MADIYRDMTDESVSRLVKAAFPGFNGKTVTISIQDTVQFYGTMYDSGNRRTYTIVRVADLTVMPIGMEPFGVKSELHDKQHPIADGFVVVVRVNSGLREYVEIISPAVNAAKLLPAPVNVTDDERIVLLATKTLKSSYGGVKNFRFHEANSARGITLERWEAAKASLIARKLLNAAGAISTEGRNIVGNDRL